MLNDPKAQALDVHLGSGWWYYRLHSANYLPGGEAAGLGNVYAVGRADGRGPFTPLRRWPQQLYHMDAHGGLWVRNPPDWLGRLRRVMECPH